MKTEFRPGYGGNIGRALQSILILMSALALAIACEAVAAYGKYRPADEDWHAHMFQLLMILQLPVMLYLGVAYRRSMVKLVPGFALLSGLWLSAFGVVHFFSL